MSEARLFRRLDRSIGLVAAAVAATILLVSTANAQVTLTTGTGSTANWTAARWASSGTTYSGTWSPGANTTFADGLSFTFGRLALSSGTASLGNLTTGTGVTIGFTTAGVGQILEFGAATRTFTIGPDSVVNFGTITLQNTGASANGLIKEGAGTLVMGGGTYTGGLQLKNGTLIASAQNLFGQGSVDIYGGTKLGYSATTFTPVAANLRSGGITVRGDFQLGLSGTAGGNNENAAFNFTNVGAGLGLNGGTRKITLGTSGTATFGQPITNGSLILARTSSSTGGFRLTGSSSMTSTEIQGATVSVLTNSKVFGTGAVTLSGTADSSLSVEILTLANDFTTANSTGRKTIAQGGAGNSIISGTITNSDNGGGLTLGALTTRTLTVGAITGSGTSGIRFGSGTGLLTGTVIGLPWKS